MRSLGCGGTRERVVSRPDSNDTRMQQEMWANGKRWGALTTGTGLGNARFTNRAASDETAANKGEGQAEEKASAAK